MVETYTKIADVIVPEVFNPYYREKTTQLNAFWQSGVVGDVNDLSFGNSGGTMIQMPFWKALTGAAQLLDDTVDLEVRRIDSGKDVAVQHARALVYGASDLSGVWAGDDPLSAIGDFLANNWSIEFTNALLATLAGALGALAAEVTPVNTLDISGLSAGASVIDGASFVDACQKLGDAKAQIVAVGMHSAVEAQLMKNDLIETIRDSEGKEVMKTFQSKRVIIDDAMAPESGGIYTTILFGNGAVGFAEGNPKVPTETDRFALKNGGEEFLVSRRHWVLHPRGIKWDPASGVPALATPDNNELADPGNWARVWKPKNIRLVRFVHKLG
jgi:hypothetical protein